MLHFLAKKKSNPVLDLDLRLSTDEAAEKWESSSKLENKRWFSKGFGLLILIAWFFAYESQWRVLSITPNMLNLLMLSLGLLFHQDLVHFSNAVKEAIKGASGILIQFPLYFGIMGILSGSGLITTFASQISDFADQDTLPCLHLSAQE